MVTFISLFLGLILGDRPVEVQPSEDVVRVELILDGEPAATLTGEPWTGDVDFGSRLLPHRLEAVAYDAAGKEIDRETQWINLVRSPAEASLSLDLDPEGRATAVSVSWETVEGDVPRSTRIELDGTLLEVGDVTRFTLPRYDPSQLHFIRVELDFSDEVVAVAEATFGGFYTDTVNTELTSVVIDLGSDREISLEDLAGHFAIDGQPQDPVAVEKGSAEIIIVRDALAQQKLVGVYRRARNQGTPKAPKDTFVRYYWTRPRESVVGERRYLLHPHSGDQALFSRTLFASFLVNGLQPREQKGSQLIAGASAVAGMAAVSRNRRRAVLVMLGEPGADASYMSPKSIREYLGALDVPVTVWTTAAKSWERTGDQGWGSLTEIAAGYRFYGAVTKLLEGLEHQRVVWFTGRHLPQDIVVSEGAPFQRVGSGESLPGATRKQRRRARGGG